MLTTQDLFDYLDTTGLVNRTARCSMILGNRTMITVCAGGPGIGSWPAQPPFLCYEVLVDCQVPRTWKSFATPNSGADSVYLMVPRLLISHYLHISGGVGSFLQQQDAEALLPV